MSVQSNSTALLLALVAIGLNATVLQPGEPIQIVRERTFSLDMRIDPERTTTVEGTTGDAGVAWRGEIRTRFPQGGGLDGIRVQVRFDSPPRPGHRLSVMDGERREVESIVDPPQNLWTTEITGGRAIIELTRTSPGASPGARFGYAYHVTPTEQQAISGENQLMPIRSAPPRIRQLGKSVARLRFMTPDGQATCTGFVVGSRLLLTNEHCIANDTERASALVDFNYDNEVSPPGGIRVREIVASDPGLDYTLLRLAADPPAGVGRLYFAPTTWQWVKSPSLHALVIVQHPSGRPKEVSIADCVLSGLNRIGVTRGDPSDFGHLCDTLGGSSGSPVMDFSSGLVVGLHHFGFVTGSRDPVNQAVVHTRILDHVKSKNGAAHTEMVTPKPSP